MKNILIILIYLVYARITEAQTVSPQPAHITFESTRAEFIRLKPADWTTEQWPLDTDLNLTTDLIYKNNHSKKSLVLSSGLHGIEGYVGSWIQQKLLQTDWIKSCSSDVYLIHALNPWGMKHHRRTDSHNIDLNRHFSINENLYKTTNEDYKKINAFLNPQEIYSDSFFEKPLFVIKSLWLILNNSLTTLRKSILKGQYEIPEGLFYGGHKVDSLQNKIQHFIHSDLKNYQQNLWIDLHTGYGAKNKLHLLANSRATTEKNTLQNLFKNHSIDFGDNQKFYDTAGDMTSYIESLSNSETHNNAIVFEYGTLDSQKTLGSIESLRRMIRENQIYHYKAINEEAQKKVQTDFDEMFFPSWPEFYEQIWQQTEPVIKSLCN